MNVEEREAFWKFWVSRTDIDDIPIVAAEMGFIAGMAHRDEGRGVMKAKRYKTRDYSVGIELQKVNRGVCLVISSHDGGTASYLTPAQARRIAAHLVKLAVMREKESTR